MRIFIVALVAFFVGCAEVAYDDEIIDERVASGESSTNQNAIDLPKATQSAPQTATKPKQTKPKIKPLATTKSNTTHSKSTKSAQKSANPTKDSQTLLDSPTKAQTPSDSPNLAIDSPNVPMIQPQDLVDSANLVDSADSIDSAHSQDSANLTMQNPSDSRILNKSTPRTKPLFDASKLNQPLPQLQVQCDSHNLQKCEDLGRIYAVQEKIDLATAHYKIACAKGKGRIMSCFFNSLIFANNGDDATSREYLDAIDTDTLSALKIDEVELMLSIGEIALIKDKLKISCISGESTSCNALLSVFKIRGELGEARAFFSTECNRVKKQNSAPCLILKKL